MSPQAQPGESVLRRLRAHGLVPAGELVTLKAAGYRVPAGTLAWTAVHPVTGASWRVGSYFTLRAVAASRHWRFVTEGDLTLVEPG